MERITYLSTALLLFFITSCADLPPRLINDQTLFSSDPPLVVNSTLPLAGSISKSIYQEYTGEDIGVGGLLRITKFIFGSPGGPEAYPERLLAVVFIDTFEGIWHPRLLELGGEKEDFGFLEVDGLPFQFVSKHLPQGYTQLSLGLIETKGGYDPFRGTNNTSIFLALYLVADRIVDPSETNHLDRIFADLAEHVRISRTDAMDAAPDFPSPPLPEGASKELKAFGDRFSDDFVLLLARFGFQAVPKLEIPEL